MLRVHGSHQMWNLAVLITSGCLYAVMHAGADVRLGAPRADAVFFFHFFFLSIMLVGRNVLHAVFNRELHAVTCFVFRMRTRIPATKPGLVDHRRRMSRMALAWLQL